MTRAEQGAADGELPRSIRLLGQPSTHKHPWESSPRVALDIENRDARAGPCPLFERLYGLFLLAPKLLQGNRIVWRVEPITDHGRRRTLRLLAMEHMNVRADVSAALHVAPVRSNGDRRLVSRGSSLGRWLLLRRRIADQHGCERENTDEGSCAHTSSPPQANLN